MIHEFSIENFLSIREEQVISFEASKDDTYEEYCVVRKGNFRLLKFCVLYGANGAGKTNFLAGLDFIKHFALENKISKRDKIGYTPFLLDVAGGDRPTRFGLSFFVNDKRFLYSVSLLKNIVIAEKLLFYPGHQPALIFDRKYDKDSKTSKVEFGNLSGIDAKGRSILEGNNLNNQSVLATYQSINVYSEVMEDAIAWFNTSLSSMISPDVKLTEWAANKIADDESVRKFVVDAMKFADFSLDDIVIEKEREVISDEYIEKLISFGDTRVAELKSLIGTNVQVETRKLIFKQTTDNGTFGLSYGMQSNGTKRYFGLSGVLYDLVYNRRIAPIDEMESSLHFELVNHFIKTFLVNASDSQLICSTHNLQILEEDFIRRDAVWFLDKDELGGSVLYPLKSFKLHKNTSILNAYKIGKLGAKPENFELFMDKSIYSHE